MSFTYEMEGIGGNSADLSLFGDLTFEDMAKKALNEVRSDVEQATKTAVRASVKHSGGSELVNSVKTFDPVMTGNGEGAKLVCTFTGKSSSGSTYNTTDRGRARKKAVLNSDKAFWLEYGVAGRQSPAPWQARAYSSIEPKVTPKIEKAIEQALGAE